jgi:EAL domain-containing protein (putative c-di-GMP-specific phosphodiesterase class I)
MRLLTRHVLHTVATQLRQWKDEGRQLRAAVNVSAEDLHDLEFIADLQAVLTAHGIAPWQVTIEITERSLITDLPRVVQAGRALRHLGVGLSLDDFGTGYASMQQLRQLPLSEVKIDRTYVSAMVESPADRAIVTSVHQLAAALGLEVVAEGIEDERTARALGRLPGTIGQGYYLGRPMSAAAIGERLRVRQVAVNGAT